MLVSASCLVLDEFNDAPTMEKTKFLFLMLGSGGLCKGAGSVCSPTGTLVSN